MDETAATTKPDWPTKAADAADGETAEVSGDEEEDKGECDREAWDTLSRSFLQAQTVLDENRTLIQKVNSNHESKIPHNMAKNVGLIRQINGNISKVLSIYSDMSTSFSGIVRQRRAASAVSAITVSGKNRGSDEDEDEESSEIDSEKLVQEKPEIVELMMAVRVHPYYLP
ncbi:protein ELF4-LIKE 1 [Arachis duranensis]|uniref:Protein EARLY FLOWERING 4 domain-containing protein n=2 Tax=Arachis TaxID=3817 RepID=A0A445C7Q9_ARAHY|nr:protein ELF4-LIKE 1 [Arachis duranensis]XP_025609907.1 protein ELF4-LIKE 1 [Arachis hypogaea]QHO28065.1 Protein ELF4-LIKE [Arachis hypogaea]RYR46972.1 hypothetical protein Ahy_A07g032865 [Arachis hypogaea]